MIYRFASLCAVAATLAACAPNTATVADFNGDSVHIQTNVYAGNADEARANADKEAERICQRGHKKRAEYASSRELPEGVVDHMYLCLN